MKDERKKEIMDKKILRRLVIKGKKKEEGRLM